MSRARTFRTCRLARHGFFVGLCRVGLETRHEIGPGVRVGVKNCGLGFGLGFGFGLGLGLGLGLGARVTYFVTSPVYVPGIILPAAST